MADLSIGQLAARTGVAASALRYYEELGLIAAPERVGGRRCYPESLVELVGRILVLRDAGFSLRETGRLLELRAPSDVRWRRLVEGKVAELEERIARAHEAREALLHGLRCPHEDMAGCERLAGVVGARLAGESLGRAHVH
ncbi:MerR family transcriptional regulator [Nonomuraea sp. NPDC050394]|uniref:MerR family transcriptional regulator n=1 Tax=Nonomuraea sp. NPDC050394 TaxID=3364363 RepID=UPI0037B7C39A